MTCLGVFSGWALDVSLVPCGVSDRTAELIDAVGRLNAAGGGTVKLSDGIYHFYSSSARPFQFYVSNHDQPDVRPVFLPFQGVTNVSIRATNAVFVMHGMGTAILLQGTRNVMIGDVTLEWERPYFAQSEIVGLAPEETHVRFLPRDRVTVEDGKLVLHGEDWQVGLECGCLFRRATHEMVERTKDVVFNYRGWNKAAFEAVGCDGIVVNGSGDPVEWNRGAMK